MINSPTTAGQLPDRLQGLLLVAALLVCQFVLVLHHLDIEQHAGTGECSICLAAHALDQGLVTGSISPAAETAAEPPGILPSDFTASHTLVRQVARGPSALALHA